MFIIKKLGVNQMPKKAMVTGYSSGIGKEIATHLENNGYEIIKLQARLENISEVEQEVKALLKNTQIDVLINCAGLGVFVPHEEVSLSKIKEMIDVNLTAPIILSNLLLRSLKKTQGHIINITSIEATKHSKFSALYTATKSGLRDFGLCLFEEVRKSGVKVTSINPDITKTDFFENLQFEPSSKEHTFLLAQSIAKNVLDILNFDGVITDITVRAQYFEIKRKK